MSLSSKRKKIRHVISNAESSSRCNFTLLSHESIFSFAGLGNVAPERQFYPDFEKKMGTFFETLYDWDVTIIFYVRRQDTFLESIYMEGFKRGYIRSGFSSFFQKVAIERMSWLHLVEAMEEFAPRTKIRIKPLLSLPNPSRKCWIS